jgi:hypothetical protein
MVRIFATYKPCFDYIKSKDVAPDKIRTFGKYKMKIVNFHSDAILK